MTRRAGRLSGTDRQIRRLTDEARSRTLAPADAAMIVLALPHGNAHRQTHARLLRTVTGTGAEWVTEEPLLDVVVRLLALARYEKSGLTGERMAALARRLVSAETVVGGPYRDRDGRVTIAANAMLLQFFIEKGTDLPRVREWLGRTVATVKPELRTIWSLTWPTVLVKDAVLPAVNKPTETIVDIAAALCLRDTNGAVPTPTSASLAAATARDFIATLPDEVREPARRAWAKICRVDRHAEITGISRRFVDSLTAPVALTDDTVDRLALANFYVWMTYTVYDDFIDGDGDPRDVPVANMMHRRAVALYGDADAWLTGRIFDAMDAADAWELAHCRFPVADGTITIGRLPHYGDRMVLARRAGAHVLGPLIVLRAAGVPEADRRAAEEAFCHYLVARQLSDDLHDWADDLAAGRISPVVSHLLRACAVVPGEYRLTELLPMLKRAFWESELVALSDIALAHITAARVLESCGVLRPRSGFVRGVIGPIRRTLDDGKRAHAADRRFVDAYAGMS